VLVWCQRQVNYPC